MSIYLSDTSAYHAEQAVAKRERAFAARQHEDWGFWDGAASMGPPVEAQAAIDAKWERLAEIILWVLFLLICAAAGWAYAHGGWR